jgi:hypothetical protein
MTILPQPSKEVYQILVDDVVSAFKEKLYNSRSELIEGHWMVGQLIREYPEEATTKFLQDLAVDTGISERTFWYALKLFDTYPDLQKLPEGKNISWNKLVTKYLTEPQKEEFKVVDQNLIKCPNCGFQFSREDRRP